MSELALLGGTPIKQSPLPWVSTMGDEETSAVLDVMNSGNLSAFLGSYGDSFFGGPKVKELESAFATKFQMNFGISVNSATTALQTAIAACEIGPGDEVLVTPYSMAATATAILMNNAIPVFVDICEDTYNLDPEEVERWITPRTKAIVVTNLFGLPADLKRLREIADQHHLFLIEDNAQGPGAEIDGKYAGTFGHLNIYSLNYHKIIHSGEGGIILTDDEQLAWKCQLIRNHGEVVIDQKQEENISIVGSNYRMTELHAAIGIEQLKKLDGFLQSRRQLGALVTKELEGIPGLTGVHMPEGYEHSYYVYPMKYNEEIWGISRSTFSLAMAKEGFPLNAGYVKPLYLLSIYQNKRIYKNTSYPFDLVQPMTQDYKYGLCPVTEKMYEKELLLADICRLPFTENDIKQFIDAIKKIKQNINQLRDYEKTNCHTGT